MASAKKKDLDILDYAPIDERGGTISVYEGDPGPVGAIALLAQSVLKGSTLPEDDDADVVAHAFQLPSD